MTALALAVSPLTAAIVQTPCASIDAQMAAMSASHASLKATDPCCDHGPKGCAQACAIVAAAALPAIAARLASIVDQKSPLFSPLPRAPAIVFAPGLLDPPPKLSA